MPPEGRPDPDALLSATAHAGRGRLVVFLGAAPGVGKTFAMLTRARKLMADGVDVVVGFAETHGRGETAALLDGLEVLPRLQVAYRGRTLTTLDLDAALARHPKVLIVDELAAGNPEGARHPKRYQDIEELLEAGIEVWTALNIQHLESAADVVAEIIGVPVRERVPDTVLQDADDVVLVDLPPAELIARLREGKVYLPRNARRAEERFFRPGNLTALRELALRRTAAHVDDDMVDYLKGHAIEGAWATAERLLVCIGPDGLSERVVRVASRLAAALNAPWLVVSLFRPDREAVDGPAAARLDDLFRLAEQLGAETRRLTATDFAGEVLKTARREHATQIVVGVPARRRFRLRLSPSLADVLSAQAGGIGIHLVTAAGPATPGTAPRPRTRPRDLVLRALPAAALCTLLACLVGTALNHFLVLPNVSLLFLMAVVVAAISAGYAAALMAAVLSGLTYNFFFIPPLYTFTIASPHEVFAFAIFLIAAFFTGGIASRVRDQARAARTRAAAVQALYDFSRRLSGAAGPEDVVWAAVSQLHTVFGRPAVLLKQDGDRMELAAAWPPDTELTATDTGAARWAFGHNEPAGRHTGTLPASRFHFCPLVGPHGVIGVCGLEADGLAPDRLSDRMLMAVLDQTAIALDRARLADEALEQAARLQGENLRAALLSSVSHDLRTPLSTITGAVTTLRQFGESMDAPSRADLLASIEEESMRLSRFVSNLLDMTRIEAGTLDARRDWIDAGDVIATAAERCARYFPQLTLDVRVASSLPLIRGDSVLLGQVLFNLIDNAAKYAPGSPVRLDAGRQGGEIVLTVTDSGPGIPAGERERVFEKFFRQTRSDGRPPGTGLGLSIARGFTEAMGGHIRAMDPPDHRGTRIEMRFPADGTAPRRLTT